MTIARDCASRLADLLRREHLAMADFLLALVDFDRQRLWSELGYTGLFPFLHRELGMSKAAAYYRKTAAELVQRFPDIIEPLRDGRLCVTAIVELAKVITPENRAEVLPRFFHCSKREAKVVSAALAPQEAPPRREVVTPVRVEAPPRTGQPGGVNGDGRTAVGTAAVHPGEPAGSEAARDLPSGSYSDAGAGIPASTSNAPPLPASPPSRDGVEPLTAELRRLHVTVTSLFLEKFEAAKAALSHTHPGGRAEEILEAGLDLVLERQAKRNGLVQKPQEKERPCAPDHVPARVRRAVWERDGGRCQWPLASGGVCGSTVRVELDHIRPRALGGPSTTGNTRLLCKYHNDLAARQAFGDGWMDRFTRRGDRGSSTASERGQLLLAT